MHPPTTHTTVCPHTEPLSALLLLFCAGPVCTITTNAIGAEMTTILDAEVDEFITFLASIDTELVCVWGARREGAPPMLTPHPLTRAHHANTLSASAGAPISPSSLPSRPPQSVPIRDLLLSRPRLHSFAMWTPLVCFGFL